MNNEGIASNDNSNTETLEKQEQPPATLETKESGQEFANKILNKIKEFMSSFTSKKEAMEQIESTVSFDDPTIKEQIKNEINLDGQIDEIDNEVEKVKTEASENVNLTIGNFSKAYHHPEYRKGIAKQIIEARKIGQDAEAVRNSFYDKTANEKENLESQEKERSVAEIMKEKDLVIVHGIPFIQGSGGSDFNNMTVDKKKLSFEDSINLVVSLEPTISTSIPSPDRSNDGLYYPAGIILGEGKILSAKSEDSGSVSFGLNKRIPKYDDKNDGKYDFIHSAIQSKVDVDKIVKATSSFGNGNQWNELTVEKPKIAGLFYDLSWDKVSFDPNDKRYEEWGEMNLRIQEAEKRKESFLKKQQIELIKMRIQSEKLGVPLYVFKTENDKINKYLVEFIEHPEYTEDYIKNVLVPKAKESFAKDEAGNYIFSKEYMSFIKNEYNPVKDYVKNGVRDYKLHLVTAEDIYNNKSEISEEKKKQMAEDLQDKKIFY